MVQAGQAKMMVPQQQVMAPVPTDVRYELESDGWDGPWGMGWGGLHGGVGWDGVGWRGAMWQRHTVTTRHSV